MTGEVGSPQPRAELLAVKLRVLVRDATGAHGSPVAFAGGAALDTPEGRWILIDHELRRALGGAVAAASDVAVVHLVVDAPEAASPDPYAARGHPAGLSVGDVARRAAFFSSPRVEVWQAEGRALHRVEPAPWPEPARVPPEVAAFAHTVAAAGADPVVEHGVLIAEVEGLEVARAYLGADGTAQLHIGVGRHDQDAFTLLHGDAATPEALAGVVQRVRRQRQPDQSHLALGRLAPERRLRRRLVQQPSLVGADHLAPIPPVVPQPNLRSPFPAAAAGDDTAGRPLLSVCSIGGDLDVVPTAADLRERAGGIRTIITVLAGDDLAVTRRIAAALAEPIEIVTVSPAA